VFKTIDQSREETKQEIKVSNFIKNENDEMKVGGG
jgi:hypothetical protein